MMEPSGVKAEAGPAITITAVATAAKAVLLSMAILDLLAFDFKMYPTRNFFPRWIIFYISYSSSSAQLAHPPDREEPDVLVD
jgi:hypothetical protein